jgi:starvation-inducible DNA-binding protein
MQKIDTGLDLETRKKLATHLNILLSHEFVLYTKTLNFHWNVKGKWFGSLHILFDNHYNQLQAIMDAVAERVRALDLPALGTMQEYLQNSSIKEDPGVYPDDSEMIKKLTEGHEAVIKYLRIVNDLATTLNDAGTNNFASGLLESHEKMAWMLRAHLQ